MKQTIILGNIITMDEKRPFAKAALVKNGLFAYIGSAEEAKKLAGADAQVLDYGDNYIYPGFLESHCHGHLAGDRFIGQANLGQVGLTDYAKYREIIKEYIAKNPQREFYLASGWVENEEHVTKAYPIKSFYDAGANVVFHSDYPVSPMMNVKYSIYMAEKRTTPKEMLGGICQPRNVKEAITREQSLRAMTINVARQWHQEHRMGSIEFGKIANMAVFDCDFLHDDIEKVAQANIVATIVDGEEVFKA